jgi:hypothetical protein
LIDNSNEPPYRKKESMSKPAQSRFLTFVVMAGFLSGVACQSHMVAEAGSVPSHHAAHEHAPGHEGRTPSHHGTHHEGSAPEDPCCVLQVADSKTLNPIVLMPETAEVVTGNAPIAAPAPQSLNAARSLTPKPPGNCSLLRQTCVLLI